MFIKHTQFSKVWARNILRASGMEDTEETRPSRQNRTDTHLMTETEAAHRDLRAVGPCGMNLLAHQNRTSGTE
ncbi:rCG44309, partial [Rattus norvegicus]